MMRQLCLLLVSFIFYTFVNQFTCFQVIRLIALFCQLRHVVIAGMNRFMVNTYSQINQILDCRIVTKRKKRKCFLSVVSNVMVYHICCLYLRHVRCDNDVILGIQRLSSVPGSDRKTGVSSEVQDPGGEKCSCE